MKGGGGGAMPNAPFVVWSRNRLAAYLILNHLLSLASCALSTFEKTVRWNTRTVSRPSLLGVWALHTAWKGQHSESFKSFSYCHSFSQPSHATHRRFHMASQSSSLPTPLEAIHSTLQLRTGVQKAIGGARTMKRRQYGVMVMANGAVLLQIVQVKIVL